MSKEQEYLDISKRIVELVGGMDNIQAVAHCATRLRIVLQDNDKADMEQLENVNKVKGAFVAGNQLQLIFGAGLVNEVYEVFAGYTHMENISLGDLKAQSAKRQNPVQAVIKSLSDVFIGIMPAILAAALLMGITGVLGNLEVVKSHDSLYAVNKLASLASTGIFAILPMAVCYSAVKRFGGNPILGMVVGAIMLDSSLANAYSVGAGTVTADVIRLFGLKIELVGFQGGIIIALMMGFIVAKLDVYFNKKIPDVVKLLFAPLLTVFVSTVLLFTVIGPVGRILSSGLTGGLVWITDHLGVFGYALFGGVQQIIVITGLHHILGAVEAQLIADTGTNFVNPLMSVALMGQGGAVLGYLSLNWKNVKARELCIPSFCSTLFGISEPAIFGVNLRYRYPLAGGCIGGAAAGAYVYLSKLTALGFGTTALPGIAIANPANHGYMNYVIAHGIALALGYVCTVVFGRIQSGKEGTGAAADTGKEQIKGYNGAAVELYSPVNGVVESIEKSTDPTFSGKIIGDGVVITEHDGKVKAPCDAKVSFVFPGGHAVGLVLADGSGILIHCGVDTVKMEGEGFTGHVTEGQQVKKGECLLTFDKALVESRGYSSEVLMIASEPAENRTLKPGFTGRTQGQDVVAVIS
ncbi:MAG: PTS transporter subunit EIIC [Hungatella sp.]|nr:PTS transporter subunit EIIC [Hungatella sp.]